MPIPFDEQISLVEGKMNHVNMTYDFTRYRGGLLYYLQQAEKLHEGVQIIHEAHGPRDVFALLAGLSLEVLLKGIHRALDNEINFPTHRLHDLCSEAGIHISSDDRIILQALSEHVAWASRYPVPNKASQMLNAAKIFDKQQNKSGRSSDYYIPERDISWSNYVRLWRLFATHFDKARKARPESAELWFDGCP